MTVITRFAPSPSGFLHVGNARSAVINWAYANSKEGKFLLRIDDTDSERSKIEFEKAIKNDLEWLGITWKKSFNQSDRISIYNKKIDILKESGKIYPCFETPEELSLKRKNLLTAGQPPIYDRSALKLDQNQINELMNQGKKPHWRFRLEDKRIEWNDIIKGRVIFEGKKLSDPILIREDGSLLYHLPSVIDDIDEKITDIIRGEDHISNTAYHIQLFEALGSAAPNFGHHPFLTDNKGKSFGKRIGSLSVQDLKNQGFENITVINYLLNIGTSNNINNYKDIKSLIDEFKINVLSSSSPKFSLEFLKSLNKDILKKFDFIDVEKKFDKLGIQADEKFWLFAKNNINFFKEIVNWWQIVDSNKSFIIKDKEFLSIAFNLLPIEPFNIKTWDIWTSEIEKKTSRKGKDLFMPLRLALTGLEKGPELKYLIPLLSRKKIEKRLGF